MKNYIICPNCGATNERYGICEYCGCDIKPIEKDVFANMRAMHGIHTNFNIDESVLKQKYDEFKDTTTISFKFGHEEGWIKIPCRYINDSKNNIWEGNLRFCYIQEGWNEGYIDWGGLDECVICIDEHHYKMQYIEQDINEDLLFSICVASSLEIRFLDGDVYKAYIDKTVIILIQLLARVFYYTFYDDTQFVDSVTQLRTFCEGTDATQFIGKKTMFESWTEMNIAEQEAQRKEHLDAVWEDYQRQKSNNQGCCILLTIPSIIVFGHIIYNIISFIL